MFEVLGCGLISFFHVREIRIGMMWHTTQTMNEWELELKEPTYICCFNKALVCSFLVVVVFVICGFPTFCRPEKKDKEATLMTRTGGAYIPPAKLRMMQQAITDKARYGRRYS